MERGKVEMRKSVINWRWDYSRRALRRQAAASALKSIAPWHLLPSGFLPLQVVPLCWSSTSSVSLPYMINKCLCVHLTYTRLNTLICTWVFFFLVYFFDIVQLILLLHLNYLSKKYKNIISWGANRSIQIYSDFVNSNLVTHNRDEEKVI